MTAHCKVAVIGSGPAGYTASIYSARAALETVIFRGMQPGGQLTITTDVENYPGFADPIQGTWLMEQMEAQAANVGVKIVNDEIVSIDFNAKPMVLVSSANGAFSADAVIIATGAQAKWLGLDSEAKFRGFGVSGCATCDGFFYKGKRVIVVGGGNTAVEEALYLTNHAAEVILVHRRDFLRAEKIGQQRLFANPKIKVMWNSVVHEITGEEDPLSVTGVRIKQVITGEITDMPIDGVFVAIGHAPNTAMFRDNINIDYEGYIITEPDSTKTNIPGVFAAGDVKDKVFRQAVTAAGMGCMAALEAAKFLADITT